MSLAKTSTGLKAIFESCFQEHQVKMYQSLCILIEEANVEQLKTIMNQFLEDLKEREPKFINILSRTTTTDQLFTLTQFYRDIYNRSENLLLSLLGNCWQLHGFLIILILSNFIKE